MSLNTAISQMMILINAIQKAPKVNRRTVLSLLQMLAPFAPHITEELLERLGQKASILTAPWPQFDPAKLTRDQVKLVFQVNGKFRGDQLVAVGLAQDDAVRLAQENPRVMPHLTGKQIQRVIFVPNKIINLVVS